MKIINRYFLTLVMLTLVYFISFIDFQKKATLSGLLIVIFSFILFIQNKNKENLVKNINFIKYPKRYLYFIYLFLLTLITQNVYLNIETVTWDVASYLVATYDVQNGNLPLETQWESKGPVLFYIYNLILFLIKDNYVLFRVANDLVIFVLSIIIFLTIDNQKENKNLALIGSSFFVLLVSKVWYVSEFSEIYCLIFIASAHYLYSSNNRYKLKYVFIGLLISLSTLINQGTLIFIIPYILIILKNRKDLLKNYFKLLISFSIPHLIFVIMYFLNDLFDIYYANYVTIPLGYTQESLSNFYELRVWLRGFYDYDPFLYSALIFLVSSYIYSNIKIFKGEFGDILILNLFASVLIYFVGSHNYYHHLFYLIYFTPLLFTKIKKQYLFNSISIFVIIANVSILTMSFMPSYNNLSSTKEVLNNYPLYQLSKEIDSYFEDEYSVFALDYLLVLHYLDKPNYSYIVHPMNHFEYFITDVLIELDRIPQNNVSKLINENPEVIICNNFMIINGEYTRIDEQYNCEVTDYIAGYIKIDTSKYLNNDNLLYYDDYTRALYVNIKSK